jgi:RND family efflux transporter MFP subunit
MRALLIRVSRRSSVWLGLVAAIGIGITVLQLQSDTAAEAAAPVATASRDDLVVSVGGVGRIVEARASGQLVVPAAVGSGGQGPGSAATGAPSAAGGGGGGVSAPADAVFPRASGHVLRFLAAPGQDVAAGQPLALLDDGGSATAAVKQAQNDVATALLELRQKETGDPLRGLPATPAELAAGRLAVASARERLARLLGPPRPADVSAARLDVRRAEADLETLLGGTQAGRAEAIRIARLNVELAQDRLDRVLAPPDPADVSAANAEVRKAEADLAVLVQPPATPLPEEIAAAQQAVAAARAKLAKLLGPPSSTDVKTANLELERARAELRTLEAGPSRAALAAARQAVDSARAKLAQVLGRPLRADVTAAQLDIGRADADLAVLRARGAPATELDIALARLKVEAARIRLAIARVGGQLLTVRAPSDGTVTALLTTRGAPVDASTPIAAVTGLDHLAVSVDLSEFDVARVRQGMRAVVSVDALGGKPFPGKVRFAALTGNDNGGVVTFPVQVGLGQAEGLRPGMNVSVRIIVAERREVVQVPLEAVARDDEDRPFATVTDSSGETSTRRLTLGLANNKSVEVVKGLKEGERVVLAESSEEGGGEE